MNGPAAKAHALAARPPRSAGRPRPLRVVHIITTMTTGGAERQVELLATHSANDVTVVALYTGGKVADSLRMAGRDVHVLGMDGWRKLTTWFRLARLVRQLEPDVVHVHLLAAQLWGVPAARLARVPVIVSSEHSLMDDTIEGRPHSRWLRFVYRRLERSTSRTVSVSRTTARRLARWRIPASRISVIENGIDFASLAHSPGARDGVRHELGASADTVVIGAIGRLAPVKRLDVAIRSCADRLRDGGHLLVIAGEGECEAGLRQLATALGVSDSIRWLGARSDVPRLLNGFDVLISTSRDETFGMAVVEALGSGLPVVYGECPALEELSELPPQSWPVAPNVSGNAEVALLQQALGHVLGCGSLPGDRYEVPAELIERYGAQRAARAIDDLHLHLYLAEHQQHTPERRTG